MTRAFLRPKNPWHSAEEYGARSTPYAESSADLTLVVNDANGNWHCSDDANGTNPMIHLSNPPSGNYNIWVGTNSSGSLQSATLYLSELSLS